MIPLRVAARLDGAISLPSGTIALDSLLMAATALRDDLPPIADAEDPAFVDIEIPVAVEPNGRFHLASFGVSEAECFEVDWTNRRFPVDEAQAMGSTKVRTVRITAGSAKSYRLPRDRRHLTGDRMAWWCIGEAEEIRDLLAWCEYIGKKRGVGLGKVREWTVESCAPWGDGFPVVREGMPMRTLPMDYPGLADDAERGYRVLRPPYWAHHRAELCAVVRIGD